MRCCMLWLAVSSSGMACNGRCGDVDIDVEERRAVFHHLARCVARQSNAFIMTWLSLSRHHQLSTQPCRYSYIDLVKAPSMHQLTCLPATSRTPSSGGQRRLPKGSESTSAVCSGLRGSWIENVESLSSRRRSWVRPTRLFGARIRS